MLKTLAVWNFALLAEARINFGAGLNILTGETGAGKSILIDALGAILGGRLSAGFIRTGEDSLRLEAVFTPEKDNAALRELLTEQAIDMEGDELILVRQMTKSGRGKILANGCHITLTVLKEIGALLADMHGQNENLALLKEAYQYSLTDNFDPKVTECLTEYQTAYRVWQKATQELSALETNSREFAQRMDMLKWQAQEIAEANLQANEDKELEESVRRLSHAEKISRSVEEAYNLLENGSRPGVLSALADVKKYLSDISRYDNSLANAGKMVDEATINLQEAAYELRDYGEAMDFSPEKLAKMQSRLDVIYKLCRKYGETAADVLTHYEKITAELNRMENYDEDILRLKKEVSAALETMQKKGLALTEARQKSAAELAAVLTDELQDLGMAQAVLKIEVTPWEKFTLRGADNLRVNFSANAGEALKPLVEVASGGELSRLALAVKAVTAAKSFAPATMVFDEIDTGIGGRTAQKVAERIAKIAGYRQVLCITHLPQIAAMADIHLYIAKESAAGSTKTIVRELTPDERQTEIARMASGVDASAAALANAQEMILTAKRKKEKQASSNEGVCG